MVILHRSGLDMDRNHAAFLELLSCAIRGVPAEAGSMGCDWSKVYELACAHKVVPFLYPVLKGCEGENDVIVKWRDAALFKSARLMAKLECVRSLVGDLDRSGVCTILLKGIALRDIYPYPELRTMEDVDILIRGAGAETAKSVLKCSGYGRCSEDRRVSVYIRPGHLPVELHTKLLDHCSFADADRIESEMCGDLKRLEKYGNVCVLAAETGLAYLLMHAYTHFTSYGVGVRQLCDIALFIGRKSGHLDWDRFWGLIDKAEIGKFTSSVFMLCDAYLGTDIERVVRRPLSKVESRFFETMMTEIIRGGVFGKRDESRVLETNILKLAAGGGLTRRGLIRAVFPRADRLNGRFAYAKKSVLLLPVAWMHRILRCITNKTARTCRYFMKLTRLLFTGRMEYYRAVGFTG